MKSFFNIFNNEDEPSKKSPLKKYLIGGIAGLCLFLVVIITIITVVLAPIMMAEQMVEDTKNKVALFFEKVGNVLTLNGWCSDTDGSCQKKAEQKYYEKLNEVYNDYQENGVEIDTQLITATIFYGNTLSEDKFQNEELDDSEELSDDTEIHLTDVKKLAKNMLSGSSLDYDKYRTYLEGKYIPKRFSYMYTPENEEKAVKKIADEIMAFATKKASGSNGGSCVTYKCNTVFLTGDNAGEYSLEDYVKGVVNAESGGFKGYTNNYKEEWKAQAIAARSMVLNNYDICTESVPNSTNFQAFKPGWSEEISEAVDETAGMVLTDNDEVYLAQYDAFFEGTGSDFHCDGELCYSTYYRRGSGNDPINWEKHTINTYSKYQSSFAPYPNGHGIGLSQWGAAYMADKGSKYDEILSFYYADNIKISKVGNSCSTNTSGYDWRQGDPEWASRSYGGATLGAVGCNFTSIVIEIARSGKQTVLPELNPGTAFDFMKARGYLGYGGDTLSYAGFSDLAPDFIHEGSIYTSSLDQAYQELVKLLDANKYPIVHVMSGNGLPYATNNHWVAVVGYTSDDIEIVDPANTGCTRLFSCKPGLDRSNGYGVVDTIQYWR